MTKKKQLAVAKSMLRQSLYLGLVDSQKVHQVLKEITTVKPVGLSKILQIYRKLIEVVLTKEKVIVESATKIADQKQLTEKLSRKTGARKILFKINPKIVFGAKITHGDWVYDETLQAKLGQLTSDN